MNSDDVSPEHNPTELEDVKTHVAEVINRWTITTEGPGATKRLTEQRASELLAELDGLDDPYVIDEWVLGIPELTNAICHYPLCFRAPRQPKNARGGRPPTYCVDGMDEKGQPHTYTTSYERRKKLREARQSTTVAVVESPEQALLAARPVSQASRALPAQLEEVTRLATALYGELQRLNELRTILEDPEQVLAEIDGIQHRARQLVEDEHGERLKAEQTARTLRHDLHTATVLTDEANAATEEALAAVTEAHRARAEAERQIATIRAEADAAVHAAQDEAQERIRLAQAELDATLAQERAEMSDAVTAADTARRQAETELRSGTEQARITVERAAQAVADMATELESTKTRASALEQEIRDLHAAAQHRDQQVETLRVEQAAEARQLRDTIEQLRDRIESMQAAHATALEQIHSQHREDVAAQLAAQHATLTEAHDTVAAEARQLRDTIEQLRDRIESMQAAHATALEQIHSQHREDVAAQLAAQRATLTEAHEARVAELRSAISGLSEPPGNPRVT
jgi:colicin import membrane protein